jgi:DNA ligase-1
MGNWRKLKRVKAFLKGQIEMNELDILEQLERVKGLKNKGLVLSKNLNNKEFNILVTYTLSFAKKFYIKKFNIPQASLEPLVNATYKFTDLLNVLCTRTITGNAAIQAVELFLSQCDERQQKWYSRVIKKDLRCGISVKTAIQAGFNIPVFDVMLATDGYKCKKLDEILVSGAYVSPKLDGYRCIAVKTGNHVGLYSRNGTYYDNFPELIEILEKCDGDFVLDGEIMSDDFQAMQKSAFASKRKTTVGDVTFHIFGFIPVKEWDSEEFTTTTGDRYQMLKEWVAKHQHQKLIIVEQKYVSSLDEVVDAESSYIEQGYEGAMVLPNIPYYKGRKANALMKFKRMESMDVKVIDTYEGTGKYVGKMGGLTVLQDNNEVCDVGSGFTDEDREWMWNNKDEVMDRIAEIQYQEMTNDNIMRFPVFLRWREDKE